MMKYERLTDKRLAIPKGAFRQSKSKEEYLELSRIASQVDNVEIYNRLAELEDKIEQRTLIELPCKVGDTIYVIYQSPIKRKFYIDEERICEILIKKDYWSVRVATAHFCLDKFYHSYYQLGSRWFLTREEAEKRLKELQNG